MIINIKKEGCEPNEFYMALAQKQQELWPNRNDPDIKEQIIAINNDFAKWDMLEKSVRWLIKNQLKNSAISKEVTDEIYQITWCELSKYIHTYDGTKAISTFVRPHVQRAVQLYMKDIRQKSSYDNEIYNKIKNAAKSIIAKGEAEKVEDITDSMIAKELGGSLSLRQIKTSREIHSLSQSSSFNPDYEAPSFATPEKAYEESEDNEYIQSILNSLNPLDRVVLEASVGLSPIVDTSLVDGVEMSEQTRKNKLLKQLCEAPEFINIIKRMGLQHHLIYVDGKEIYPESKMKRLYLNAVQSAQTLPTISKEIQQKDDLKFRHEKKALKINFGNKNDALESELSIFESLD